MNRVPVRRRFRPKSNHFRLVCQWLEDRLAPATFTVANLTEGSPGSLRAALTSANTMAGADTITFQAGLAGTITLASELAITESVSIIGLGLGTIVVSGNNVTRVFNTTGAAAEAGISFINLVIANGKSTSSGGGILAGDEALSLITCIVSANGATGATSDGGGIAVTAAAGTLSLVNCTITSNHSDSRHGGGIDLSSGVAATITNSTIANNTAFDAGGGIHSAGGSLTITNSTVASNNGKRGGGLNFFGTVGAGGLTIRNSTLSGNSSTDTGGGVDLLSFTGALTVQNSTISANTAGGSGGGGIGRVSGTGSIFLESSVVTGNTDSVGANEDLFTTGTVNGKYSAVFNTTGVTTFTPDITSKYLVGVNHKLGALSSNGGSGGQTHVPAPDSPLINKGSNPAALTTDQRGGVTARNSNGGVDIGAVELQVFLVTTTANSGTGSLRTAINNANAFGGSDTVAFDPAVSSITLTSGEIAINEAVSIIGPAAKVTINGNANGRIFNTTATAEAQAAIVIQNLTLTNGSVNGHGGAILVGDEALTLRACALTNNSTTGVGGAVNISDMPGSLLVEDCTLTGNSAPFSYGGAIQAFGPVIVRRSTLSGNIANIGGAINVSASFSLTIEDSTLSGNTATESSATINGGGAISFSFGSGTLLISNTTVSGNAAPSTRGGGVCLTGFNGTALFRNSTITGNSAGLIGGGIARASGSGTVSLSSTIVAGNSNANGPDLAFDQMTDVGGDNNLVGVSDAGFFKLTGSGNKTGMQTVPLNAKLAALANNGGPTLTHLPLIGSPVIDKGNNNAALANDQRGASFPRVSGPAADIGAVERLSVLVSNADDAGNGSLRQAILNANSNAGPDTIGFLATFFTSAKTITLTTGEIAITDALSIIAPSVNRVTIDANAAGRIFNMSGAGLATPIVLENLTITNGKVSGDGGAIIVGSQALTLQDCAITNSTASSRSGAIHVSSSFGSLLIEDCTLAGNRATSDVGGAIGVQSSSKVAIHRSTLSGNTAARSGGAIYFADNIFDSSLTVEYCTLSGNTSNEDTANRGGGAICFRGTPATFLISNSTLSGNSAPAASGGAVLLQFSGGPASFQNCTITGNAAGINGGAIARTSGTGTVSLSSTIIAGNTNSNTPDLSFNSATNVGGTNNLVGVIDVGNFTLTGAGNLVGTKASPLNAKLGTLANNGGPTLTHMPMVDSPVRDKGSNPAVLSNDQRGPGFRRELNAIADIGAVDLVPFLIVRNANDSGPDSLRQAVVDASSIAGAETVTFDPVFFAAAKTIALITGEIPISGSGGLTIAGPAAKVTIDGNAKGRVFDASGPSGNAAILLQGLILTNGKAPGGNGHGGAVLSDDQALTLRDCTITNSTALFGGAIQVFDNNGSLLLEDCQLTGNSAGAGGAIVSAHVIIRRSTLSGNLATSGGGAVVGFFGSLTIEDSALSGNTASGSAAAYGGGGAIYFYGATSKFLISNTTLSGNSAPNGYGGALLLSSFVGNAGFQNSTVTGNVAGAKGGGIARVSGSGAVLLSSTLVAGNSASFRPDFSFDTVTNVIGDNNLIGAVDPSNMTLLGTGNQTGTLAAPLNAKLGPLANNGGPTLTHALLAGSPALDKGNNLAALTNDQRGAGFPRVFGTATDVGAFEVQAAAPAKVALIQVNGGAVQRSRVTTISLTFDQIVAFAGAPEAAFQLVRPTDGKMPAFSAAVNNSGPSTVVTLSFSGTTAVESSSLADGRYTLTALAAQINGSNFDGNGDGTPGDNYSLIGSPANGLFRLFGDSNGDGTVNGADFLAFRLAFLQSNATFDFDGDGQVTGTDFLQFRLRFLQII